MLISLPRSLGRLSAAVKESDIIDHIELSGADWLRTPDARSSGNPRARSRPRALTGGCVYCFARRSGIFLQVRTPTEGVEVDEGRRSAAA